MRKWKKVVSIGILCTLMANLYPVQASSNEMVQLQANTIIPISINGSVNGAITEAIDANTYQFDLSQSGILNLDFKAYIEYYGICLYDQMGNEVWSSPSNNQWNEQLKFQNDIYSISLEAGRYYLEVNGYEWGEYDKKIGTYQFTTNFLEANETYKEVNNDFSTASNLMIGKTIKGLIAENDGYDVYKVNLKQSGKLKIKFTSYMKYYCINLYDESGAEIWNTANNEWKEQTKKRSDNYELNLEKGIYYIEVNGYESGEYNKSTGLYEFSMSFINAKATKSEPNDEFSTAKNIKTGEKVVGQIAINDDYDFYKLNLKSTQKLMFHMTSYMKYYCINIYDKDGNKIWDKDFNTWDENLKRRNDKHELTLKKGLYYVEINGYEWDDYNKSTGTYNFTIKKAVLPKSIRLNRKSLVLKSGKSYQLKATIAPKNTDYKTVHWESKNHFIASVDENGKVFAYNKGVTTIVAYTENNKKYICKVRVK